MASNSPSTPKVEIKTTLPLLPLPPIAQRATIQTSRLLLRPLTQFDLQAYFLLRQDPKFMSESSLGTPDTDISTTQNALNDLTTPPSEHFIVGIFLATTGELIGDGGIHSIHGSLGWPEIGYKLHPRHWGQGYATEAMSALLGAWWALPREEVQISTHPSTLNGREGEREELVVAEIATYNTGSQRVLEKLGFEHFATWEELDTQLHRLGQPIMIGHFALSRPGVAV
ncbi:acetyltransferase domain-containing protein [Xylaria nigripes]|nr:acetyltransferase domain-containing protein [Xylaria nigripes]